MGERVVVTGLGAVTPLGNDVATYWDGLTAGRSGVGPISAYDATGHGVQIAAEVKDLDMRRLLGPKRARRTDRFTQMALIAANEAVADARLDFGKNVPSRRGAVVLGTAVGGITTLLNGADVLKERGERRVSPLLIPMMMSNAAAGEIAIDYGLHGLTLSPVSACASGAHAIGEATRLIRTGTANVVICGGSEAGMHPLALAAFNNMQAISRRNNEPERASRPFDAHRDGFVQGEGAGVLILESLSQARERGARIYAELVGYGASTDAFHITAPDEQGTGAALSMARALDDAHLEPEQIDYVNAHGTSTPLNDAMETWAIRQVFGEHADALPVSSTKSMIGHLLGAAGAVEAVASIKSLETGVLHPTINYETPDPDCDLDYVPNQARETHPRTALSNSFGFGGHNASLLFAAWEG
ncbi:MAG: beta-ketoacyl-ACP synthase II [Anaerolineae bacterium]|jgi:3-oxoacyl-[acyl-carrier-protein] synthase II